MQSQVENKLNYIYIEMREGLDNRRKAFLLHLDKDEGWVGKNSSIFYSSF